MIDRTVEDWLTDLKAALTAETDSGKLERLAAALIGKMIGVQITVARSGFQFGGDAGASGRQGRRLRLEAKRYLESTRHNDRELLGELDQALAADPALEAWILVTTRSLVEQTELQLLRKGEEIGVPVIFLDWKLDAPIPSLAALCAFDPVIVGELFSPAAETASRALTPVAAPTIAALRRDLETWNLGYTGLRSAAAAALNDIWSKPRQAMANFGQDAAGGAEPKKIRRQQVHAALDDWWAGPAATDAPAILLGLGGAGKTWAALDWLVDRQADLPIILTAPSAMGAAIGSVSETRIKELLAQRLYELSPGRDHAHWLRRVDRLLRRPLEEGPVILVLFDGVNQEESAPWLKMFRMLQGQTFAGRVRVMASTRPLHNEQELGGLQGLMAPAVTVPVALYDLEPAGELDQMLAYEGLDRSALDPHLIELARVPRLFKLVVRFGARLIEAGQVTVHRLLWEYGRDTLGVRAGVSFSEAEWRDWLVSVAKDVRDGVETYSRARLSQSLQQAHLTPGQVFQRMSEIVDSKLVDHAGTSVKPIPLLVDHALAAALLDHLGRLPQPTDEAVDTALLDWLDPIAGLDERARILRAAVSIQIETGQGESPLTGLLVVAWLQGQNTPDQHRREVEKLAPLIVEPLLAAVWRSRHPAQTSAKTWALRALDTIARDDLSALSRIVTWARRGLSEISRDFYPRHASEPQIESHRRRRVLDNLGFDENGERLILGISMRVVDNHDAEMGYIVSRVLKGFPLAPAVPAFEAAAISASAGENGGWEALAWLCLLNEVDPEPMAQALCVLSADVAKRRPEADVSAKLGARTAARLVRLTGREEDDHTALKLRPPEGQAYSYETNYLPRPIASFGFALEARHVHEGLLDQQIPFHTRSSKSSAFWLDPGFQPPAPFVAELITVAQAVDLKLLDGYGSRTSEDFQFEELAPMLARCAPRLLADLMRAKVAGFAARPAEGRYWAAIRATDDILVHDAAAAAPAKALRTKVKDRRKNEETFAASMLLTLETLEASPFDQIEAFLNADLAFVLMDLEKVIKPLTAKDRARLLDRFDKAPSRQRQNLAMLMSFHAGALDERTWRWFEVMAKDKDDDGRGIAFRALTSSDPGRFGQTLLTWDWRWEPKGANGWTTHFGSVALIKASLGLPFEQIIDRIAPWLLPYAVRERGDDPEEGELVAEVLGRILATTTGQTFEPGVDITVTVDKELDDPWPYSLAERDDPNPLSDPNERLAGLLDGAMRRERRQKSIEAALDYIRAAQEGGAYLVLRGLSKCDLEGIVRWAPDQIDRWLEGMEHASDAFLDRVHFGEHLFLSLCKALLDAQPERGAELWRALRAAFTSTRFLGKARINALVLAPFQAQSSAPVEALRLELYDTPHAKTDADLFEVVQAALIEGRSDWLEARIAEDQASPLIWRRRRGKLLTGWLPGAIKEPFWFEGLADTSLEALGRNAIRSARTDVWARHWWGTYLSATTPEAAYAAWTLFMTAADRRALVWMRNDRAELESTEMAAARARHEGVNRQRILGDLEKKPKDLANRFLGLNIVKGVGLWAEDEG